MEQVSKTQKRRVVGGKTWTGLSILAVLLLTLTQYENALDAKIYGGVGAFFALHSWLWPIPDGYITASCNELNLIHKSKTPIIFKDCFKDKRIWDFVYFGDEAQNMFTECERVIWYKPFTYVGYGDESAREVNIFFPCTNHSLREKVGRFYSRNLDNPALKVHAYLLNQEQVATVEQDLRGNSIFPEDFSLAGRFLGHNYLMSSGTESVVNYYHSHPDNFLSFGVKESKIWELVHPKYHDDVEYDIVISPTVTRELRPIPKNVILQEEGDILYVPAWWIHKTSITNSSGSFGFNIHYLAKGQYLGYAAEVFRFFGMTLW